MADALCDAIIDARATGVCHCGMVEESDMTLAALAEQFGLLLTIEYFQVERDKAQAIASYILYKDLAYHSEIMPAARLSNSSAIFSRCLTGNPISFTRIRQD